ncbi:hypothetical protein MMC20_000985, partial [Loxospora ochrophaea]|nr:hypothetical protein [Loxospora ochrophaea]
MHSSIPSLVALVNSSLQASERNLPLDESARSTALSAASKLKGALQTPEEALFEHAFM